MIRRPLAVLASLIASLAAPLPALAWDMSGTRQIVLHTREGQAIPLGTVKFTPAGRETTFELHLDHARFKDYFLSMKEFKCLEGNNELQCHVPYPYPHAGKVSAGDLRWLEHALLFLYKSPKDFGAKLWNGLYYRMQITDKGIVGTPQAVDLNAIGAPPADPSIPPYGPGERTDIVPESRWFSKLTIE